MRHKGIEWCTYQFAWAEFNSTDPFFNLFFRRQPCNKNGLIWAHWKRLTTAASFWRFEYLINWKQLALFQTDCILIHFQTSNTFHFFTPEQSTKEKKILLPTHSLHRNYPLPNSTTPFLLPVQTNIQSKKSSWICNECLIQCCVK